MTTTGSGDALLSVRKIFHVYPTLQEGGIRRLCRTLQEGRNGEQTTPSAPAIRSVSFEVSRGEICSIVGKSGSGKSTLLRVIAGLLRPTKGTILLDGKEILSPSCDLAVVFQDYSRSLLPWKTVAGNLQVGLLSLSLGKAEEKRRIRSYLEIVGLYANSNKYPWELSGGMQQRVAMARALARQPKVLLLDEPFGALDSPTRFELEDEMLRVARELGITVLMITHDIDEAVYMSDRVLIMAQNGTLEALPGESLPSSVIPIPLGERRNQIETRADPRFAVCRARIVKEMHLIPEKDVIHA